MATNIVLAKTQITNGPCKLDLMLALFDANNTRPRPVVFVVAGEGQLCPGPVEVQISSVEREDGSGESFNLKGRWDFRSLSGLSISYNVEGYYSTKTRTGTVTLTYQ